MPSPLFLKHSRAPPQNPHAAAAYRSSLSSACAADRASALQSVASPLQTRDSLQPTAATQTAAPLPAFSSFFSRAAQSPLTHPCAAATQRRVPYSFDPCPIILATARARPASSSIRAAPSASSKFESSWLDLIVLG